MTAKIGGIIETIEDSAWSAALRELLRALEACKRTIREMRLSEPAPTNVVKIWPATAGIYRKHIFDFTAALSKPKNQAAASETLQSLIDNSVVISDATAIDRYKIEPYGDSA